jgi:hypothetical protein
MAENDMIEIPGMAPPDAAALGVKTYRTKAAKQEWVSAAKVHPEPSWRERVFTAESLQNKVFPALRYVVPNILPEGLGMLAGRPKIGKSWMALDIALAVATPGGTCLGGLEPDHGDVLYAACEDSERRLQSRITRLAGAYREGWPKTLHLATGWRRLDQGGVIDIAEWITSVENPRLAILDTLASVKPIKTNNGYQEDYAALENLHHLMNNVGIAGLILHHQRKSEAEDPLDTISGTLGLAGCLDTPIVLQGGPAGMTLYVRGRDVVEMEKAVIFDKATCRWSIAGEAADVQRSDTRQKILGVLRGVHPKTMGPSDIAGATGLKPEVVKVRLGGMLADGEVIKTSRGEYSAPPTS